MERNSPEYTLEQEDLAELEPGEFGIETSLYFDDIHKDETKLTESVYRGSTFQDDLENETLLSLARTVEETGCLLPLIKEELKCKIQARRLASGQEELVIKEEKPKLIELSPDDIRKREMRKEQNRRAARRYRTKQREFLSNDRKEKMRLEAENSVLLTELSVLRQEIERLNEIYQQHMIQCTFVETVCNVAEITTDFLAYSSNSSEGGFSKTIPSLTEETFDYMQVNMVESHDPPRFPNGGRISTTSPWCSNIL